MTDRERTLRLLQQISSLTGVDCATFMAFAQEAEVPGGDDQAAGSQDTLLLLRLIRAYRALPTAEARFNALQIIESLAVRPIPRL